MNCEIDLDDEQLYEWATDLFELFMLQYCYWCDPTRGAVSPKLSEFFAYCAPVTGAEIHWARWLRIEHESDHGIDIIRPPMAEALVEAIVTHCRIHPSLAALMRRAVQGEPIGERDPDQLSLF
jgi:hypothetical protein